MFTYRGLQGYVIIEVIYHLVIILFAQGQNINHERDQQLYNLNKAKEGILYPLPNVTSFSWTYH